jgi:hypothetical protein
MVRLGRILCRMAGRFLLLLGLGRRRSGVPGVLCHCWASPASGLAFERQGSAPTTPCAGRACGAYCVPGPRPRLDSDPASAVPGLRAMPYVALGLGRVFVAAPGGAVGAILAAVLRHAQRSCW